MPAPVQMSGYEYAVDARLDELDEDDWLLVVRVLVPELTDAEYHRMWQGFCDAKAEHEREKGLH